MREGAIHTRFAAGIDSYWQRMVVGRGALVPGDDGLRLVNRDTSAQAYTNAQIDDYQHLPRRRFPWRPPLTLTVRARFSHPGHDRRGGQMLQGTAGFGFWNDPFLMTGLRMPALPRVIWFFYSSPPSNMALDLNTPGWGWKASTIDAAGLPFYLLAPTAPLALPLMNIRPLYRRLWPLAQRAMHVREALVNATMAEWHIYHIAWGTKTARFSVDGRPVLTCATPPRGPLGLVIWLDNQYMVATPWGRFAHGCIATSGSQWLELDWLAVEPRWPGADGR